MINKKILFIPLLISGCASSPFNPQVGMTLKDVSSASNIACLPGGKSQYDNLEFIRFHPYSKEISEYKIKYDLKHSKKFQDYMDSKEPGCRQSLFFYESKLISIDKVNEIIRPNVLENIEKDKIRIKNELIVAENKKIKDEQQRKDNEENERKLKALEKEKLELLVIQTEKLNKILLKNNYNLFYRNEDFAIVKDKNEKLIYLKDGIVKNKSEVLNDLIPYENELSIKKAIDKSVALQIEREKKEQAELNQILKGVTKLILEGASASSTSPKYNAPSIVFSSSFARVSSMNWSEYSNCWEIRYGSLDKPSQHSMCVQSGITGGNVGIFYGRKTHNIHYKLLWNN